MKETEKKRREKARCRSGMQRTLQRIGKKLTAARGGVGVPRRTGSSNERQFNTSIDHPWRLPEPSRKQGDSSESRGGGEASLRSRQNASSIGMATSNV